MGLATSFFYSQNGQYYVKVDSLCLVRDLLQQMMMRALQAANSALLSLPAYSLVPKFFFGASSNARLFSLPISAFLCAPSPPSSMGTNMVSYSSIGGIHQPLLTITRWQERMESRDTCRDPHGA
jgi:hypothetical protein